MLSIIHVIWSSSYYKTVRKITFLGCLGAEEGGGGRAACRVVCGLRRLRYSARWGSGLADSWSRRRLRLAATCECLRAAHLNAANTTYSHQLRRLHTWFLTENVVGHTFNSTISCKDENNLEQLSYQTRTPFNNYCKIAVAQPAAYICPSAVNSCTILLFNNSVQCSKYNEEVSLFVA